MSSRPAYTEACFRMPFSKAGWRSGACLYHSLLIHSSVDGHWWKQHCFHLLDIEYNATFSMDRQISFWFFGVYTTGISLSVQFNSVQLLSHVRRFATPWTAACQASWSIQLPESTQTHVHCIGNAIHPSHPLPSPSPPAPSLSQQQGLFKWVSSLHQVAKVLKFQLQHQSFQWTPRTDLL